MDIMENLGVKDKESLADNGRRPYQELFCVFHVQISSQNHEAFLTHPIGETNIIIYIQQLVSNLSSQLIFLGQSIYIVKLANIRQITKTC